MSYLELVKRARNARNGGVSKGVVRIDEKYETPPLAPADRVEIAASAPTLAKQTGAPSADAPPALDWPALAAMRWGLAIGDPEPGIIRE